MAGEFATDLDGTNDYYLLGADLTGNADGKVGIFSAWFRLDGGDGAIQYFVDNVAFHSYVQRNAANNLLVVGKNSGGDTILDIRSATTYTISSSCFNVIASCDMTLGWDLYVNDVSDKGAENTFTDDTIDYTTAQWGIAARFTTGASSFNGALSEFYFTNEYLNLSVAANRRKFISASGKPVPLGPDGSGPTGTAAIIYAPDGNPTVNQGTGGNFTENGAPVRIAGPNKRTVNAALISGV